MRQLTTYWIDLPSDTADEVSGFYSFNILIPDSEMARNREVRSLCRFILKNAVFLEA